MTLLTKRGNHYHATGKTWNMGASNWQLFRAWLSLNRTNIVFISITIALIAANLSLYVWITGVSS